MGCVVKFEFPNKITTEEKEEQGVLSTGDTGLDREALTLDKISEILAYNPELRAQLQSLMLESIKDGKTVLIEDSLSDKSYYIPNYTPEELKIMFGPEDWGDIPENILLIDDQRSTKVEKRLFFTRIIKAGQDDKTAVYIIPVNRIYQFKTYTRYRKLIRELEEIESGKKSELNKDDVRYQILTQAFETFKEITKKQNIQERNKKIEEEIEAKEKEKKENFNKQKKEQEERIDKIIKDFNSDNEGKIPEFIINDSTIIPNPKHIKTSLQQQLAATIGNSNLSDELKQTTITSILKQIDEIQIEINAFVKGLIKYKEDFYITNQKLRELQKYIDSLKKISNKKISETFESKGKSLTTLSSFLDDFINNISVYESLFNDNPILIYQIKYAMKDLFNDIVHYSDDQAIVTIDFIIRDLYTFNPQNKQRTISKKVLIDKLRFLDIFKDDKYNDDEQIIQYLQNEYVQKNGKYMLSVDSKNQNLLTIKDSRQSFKNVWGPDQLINTKSEAKLIKVVNGIYIYEITSQNGVPYYFYSNKQVSYSTTSFVLDENNQQINNYSSVEEAEEAAKKYLPNQNSKYNNLYFMYSSFDSLIPSLEVSENFAKRYTIGDIITIMQLPDELKKKIPNNEIEGETQKRSDVINIILEKLKQFGKIKTSIEQSINDFNIDQLVYLKMYLIKNLNVNATNEELIALSKELEDTIDKLKTVEYKTYEILDIQDVRYNNGSITRKSIMFHEVGTHVPGEKIGYRSKQDIKVAELEAIAAVFNKRGVKVNIVNEDTMKQISGQADVSGWNANGIIYLNRDANANLKTACHELAHLILGLVRAANPERYSSLLQLFKQQFTEEDFKARYNVLQEQYKVIINNILQKMSSQNNMSEQQKNEFIELYILEEMFAKNYGYHLSYSGTQNLERIFGDIDDMASQTGLFDNTENNNSIEDLKTMLNNFGESGMKGLFRMVSGQVNEATKNIGFVIPDVQVKITYEQTLEKAIKLARDKKDDIIKEECYE